MKITPSKTWVQRSAQAKVPLIAIVILIGFTNSSLAQNAAVVASFSGQLSANVTVLDPCYGNLAPPLQIGVVGDVTGQLTLSPEHGNGGSLNVSLPSYTIQGPICNGRLTGTIVLFPGYSGTFPLTIYGDLWTNWDSFLTPSGDIIDGGLDLRVAGGCNINSSPFCPIVLTVADQLYITLRVGLVQYDRPGYGVQNLPYLSAFALLPLSPLCTTVADVFAPGTLSVEPTTSRTGGAAIMATFTPKCGSIDHAAQIFGDTFGLVVDHFNWQSFISRNDVLSLTPDFLRDQFGLLPSVPYWDPPLGGYYYECLYRLGSATNGVLDLNPPSKNGCPIPIASSAARPLWGPLTSDPVADNLRWYWDEVLPGIDFVNGGDFGSISEIKSHTTGTALTFYDQPCSPNNGEKMEFYTALVEVQAGGYGAPVNLPGTWFKWSYTSTGTNCAIGGGSGGVIQLLTKNDGSIQTTGGKVTFEGFVDPNEIPDDVLSLTRADTIPPVTTASIVPGPDADGWNNTPVEVSLDALDNSGGTGTRGISFVVTGAQTGSGGVNGIAAAITIAAEGITTLKYFAIDKAGNQELPHTHSIRVDTSPPTTAAFRTPDPNTNDWNNSTVTVTFQCSDAFSGLASGSPPAPTTISTQGARQSVKGTCADLAGNSTSLTVADINIDTTAPTVTYSNNAGHYTADQIVNVVCSATDAVSGIASSTCANIVGPAYTFSLGSHSYSATAIDKAGNQGSGSTSFSIDVNYSSLIAIVRLFETKADVAADMIATLQGAEAALARGNVKTANNQLNLFIQQVSAQSGKSLTTAQAAVLIQLAGALKR